jgi:hypothetical protein
MTVSRARPEGLPAAIKNPVPKGFLPFLSAANLNPQNI